MAVRTVSPGLCGSDDGRAPTSAQRPRPAVALPARRLSGVVALVVLMLLAGCGSGSVTLPDRTALPSISLPALPTLPGRTETATATATTTETATATETATETATVTVSASVPPAAAPTSEPSQPEADDGGLWWLLILLAVIAGLAVALVAWSRSRGASKEIDRRFELVHSKLTWTDTDLLPRVLSSPTTAEAAGL